MSLCMSVPPDGTIVTRLILELYIGTLPVAGRFKIVSRVYIPFDFRLKILNIFNPVYWNNSSICE